jgi:hypothetical protein
MKVTKECCVVRAVATALLFIPALSFAKDAKTYKHAPEYQVAILDQNLRVETGSDVTLGKNTTDAKLGPGGQGIHLLHTDAGDYRVEAPVNKGLTFLSAMGSNASNPAKTYHNKWFLDNVQPGTKVLFASECAKPNKKHPTDAVRCSFYFPDPDSSDHEYATLGDFTPLASGDGSNTQKTANTLCGTGKLKPEVEAQLCGGTPAPVTAPAPAAAAPAADSTPAPVPEPADSTPAPASATPASAPTPAAYQQQDSVRVQTAVQTTSEPISQESLGDAARKAKQHKACLDLAKDNPSIICK